MRPPEGSSQNEHVASMLVKAQSKPFGSQSNSEVGEYDERKEGILQRCTPRFITISASVCVGNQQTTGNAQRIRHKNRHI